MTPGVEMEPGGGDRPGGEALDGSSGEEPALHRLAIEYGCSIDAGDGERFASLFKEGGELIACWRESERPLATFRSPEDLHRLVAATWRSSLVTFHSMTNYSYRVEGDTASGQTYCTASHLLEDEGRRSLEVISLRYDDRCERGRSGWRFAERRAVRLWAERRQPEEEPLLIDKRIAADLTGHQQASRDD